MLKRFPDAAVLLAAGLLLAAPAPAQQGADVVDVVDLPSPKRSPDFAQAGNKEIPLNFDTQLIRIFAAVLKPDATELSGLAADPANDRKVFKRILDKLRKHQMALKNAVYRTDMGVIRLTWADDANHDVVKVAYKTGKDPVLGNSAYADKRQVIDVKIMYRDGKNSHEYLHLESNALLNNTTLIAEKPTYNYLVQDHLPNEQCGFCHILAQNDGSVQGIFFPRYQETYKQSPIKSGLLFRAEHFTRTPAAEAEKLGLPKMGEDFLYQKVRLDKAEDQDEATRFARTLIELPQLIEVMARDNGQSTCVAVDFGEGSEHFGLGRNDYVCADNQAQLLYVRLTNSMLSINKGAKEYSEAYFAKY